jgi:hypothetical protein
MPDCCCVNGRECLFLYISSVTLLTQQHRLADAHMVAGLCLGQGWPGVVDTLPERLLTLTSNAAA